jgi:hypothetical protein
MSARLKLIFHIVKSNQFQPSIRRSFFNTMENVVPNSKLRKVSITYFFVMKCEGSIMKHAV